jgi:hypothetical protein
MAIAANTAQTETNLYDDHAPLIPSPRTTTLPPPGKASGLVEKESTTAI